VNRFPYGIPVLDFYFICNRSINLQSKDRVKNIKKHQKDELYRNFNYEVRRNATCLSSIAKTTGMKTRSRCSSLTQLPREVFLRKMLQSVITGVF
jgi:hypothetical protein